jgi:hypothetical protein
MSSDHHHCLTCEHGPDYTNQKVLEDIAREGWSGIGVFPTEVDGTMPFNYTVGLVEYSHPDLIVMGLHNTQAHGVLCTAVNEIEGGMIFRPDTLSDQVLENYEVAFVEVDDILHDVYPMSMTHQLYGAVQALQIVWPDIKGRFPWHSDFDPDFKDRQVLLGTWKGST